MTQPSPSWAWWLEGVEPENPDYYTILARGTSMNRAGIERGDTLYVHRSGKPRRHDVVIAEVPGKGTTVKRWRPTSTPVGPGPVWLVPESSVAGWLPTRVTEGVKLLGVVLAVRKAGSDVIDYHFNKAFNRPVAFPGPNIPFEPMLGPLTKHERALPPFAEFLMRQRQLSAPGISAWEFARAIGLDAQLLDLTLEGWVPEKQALLAMAPKLQALTGVETTARHLRGFLVPQGDSRPFFAKPLEEKR